MKQEPNSRRATRVDARERISRLQAGEDVNLDDAKAEAERVLAQPGDGVNARRAAQAKVVIEQARARRATMPKGKDDHGVGEELLAEMDALAPLRGRVNAENLD